MVVVVGLGDPGIRLVTVHGGPDGIITNGFVALIAFSNCVTISISVQV